MYLTFRRACLKFVFARAVRIVQQKYDTPTCNASSTADE